MLTGELPFPYTNHAALLYAHLYKPAPDPCHVQPGLEPHMAKAILQALEKSPDQRPPSAGAFAGGVLGLEAQSVPA